MRQPLNPSTPLAMRKWKPYPAYKDSGVEWLGKIPVHWEVKQPKNSKGNEHDELDLCPVCGGVLIFSDGCYICRDCGYTKCD